MSYYSYDGNYPIIEPESNSDSISSTSLKASFKLNDCRFCETCPESNCFDCSTYNNV